MKLFSNTGTVLDEIEEDFRDDGTFAVSHWPDAQVSGDGRFLRRMVESMEAEAWFAFHPFGRPGDAVYGWGTRAEAERYQAFENRGCSPDSGEWLVMDRVDGEGTDNLDGFNISDFFAGNPEAAAA